MPPAEERERSRSPRRAAAGEPEGPDLKDAVAYLGACGVAAAGLPLLGVKFGKTEIKGAASRYSKKAVGKALDKPPKVTWDPKLGTCTLVYLDPDAPDRDGDDGTRAGVNGPWLHWLVTECEGGQPTSGKEHVRHMGPAPPRGTHRYIFVLFQQEKGVKIPCGIERQKWDFKAFVEANRGVLRPAALNFFYCNGD